MSTINLNTAPQGPNEIESPESSNSLLLSFLELKTFLFLMTCIVTTIFIYYGSTKFVQNVIEEKNNKISQNNIELFIRELKNRQLTLTMVGTMEPSLNTYNNSIRHQQFNEIIILEKMTGTSKNQWKIRQKQDVKQTDQHHKISAHQKLISILNTQETPTENHLSIITDPTLFTQTPASKENNAIVPLILTWSPTKAQHWVATINIENIFNEHWLRDNSISRLNIKDTTNDNSIYDFNHSDQKDQLLTSAHEFSFANKKWDVTTEFFTDTYISNLKRLPRKVLLICIIVSTIGLLFFIYTTVSNKKVKQANNLLNKQQKSLEKEIQKRKILDRELGTSEREKRALADAVSDIIFETDLKGKILFLNASWTKITGFHIEQTTGKTLFEMLHPQDQKQQEKDFNLMIEGKKSAYKTYARILKTDGSFHAIDLAISMIRQDGNKNLRVVGTMTDMEGQERAEKALKEAEQKYRTIVENAAGGIFQMSPEGLFLSSNPALCRILGYATTKELTSNIKDANTLYIDQKQRTKMLNELKTIGMITNYESQIKKRNGTHIWINENIRTVRDDERNIIYFEGSMEDITERKESDFILKEAKMHSDMANRGKSEFLANMSHELRTPLNAIIGFSEIIKEQSFGEIEKEEYVNYATDIHKSGRNLLKIITDILDISKIEANQRPLQEEQIPLNAIIDESLDMLKSKIGENRIIISKQYDTLPEIIAEHIAIKQMMINILSNAIKFTPPNGHISIDVHYEDNNNLRLSFTDTGIGLNPEDIPRILEPFGQVEETHARQYGGIGLGLTLVNALIKLHGGTLDILSQKGIGTTVTLTLPSDRIIQKNKINQETQST